MKNTELEKIIFERRTIHEFQDVPVEESVLYRAVESVIYAPNHKLTFPWQIIRLGPNLKTKIASTIARKKRLDKNLSEAAEATIKNQFIRIPEMLIFVQKIGGSEFQQKEDYAAIACGIQNFGLYLWGQGYGCKWSTTQAIQDSSIYQELGLDIKVNTIVGLIFVGVAKKIPPISARPELNQVFSKTK